MLPYFLIAGIVLIVLILLGREVFNWYIKHNTIIEELSSLRAQNSKTNSYLKNIENELKRIR